MARIVLDNTRSRMVVNSGDSATFRATGGTGPQGEAGPPGDSGSYSVLDHGVVADGDADDTVALRALFTTTIPDFEDDWGPANNFDVSGVPAVHVPPGSVIRLTSQIVIPRGKAFTLWCASKGGARIVYEGAQTRADGVTVVGDKTLVGSGFTADDENADILIRGAGDGGSTLVTWIQTYTDSTHVELAHAPRTAIGFGATYVLRFSAFRKGDDHSDTRGIPYMFRNLVFQYGGLCFNNGTKPVVFDDCDFHETVGPALVALNKDNTAGNDADEGTGSVTLLVRRAMFNHCNGAIWHLAKTAGLSKYEDVRTNVSHDIPIVLRSGFHQLDHVDFQGMESTITATMPHLWISPDIDVGGRTVINNVRFGSEADMTEPGEGGVLYESPFANIVVGPLSGPVVSTGHNDPDDEYDVPLTRPEEIRITGQSWFGGRASGGPTATSAKHAIVLNKMCEGLSIKETKFSKYYAELINEAWVEANPDSGTARQNINGKNWFDPSVTISDTHRAGIFTHNGADWRPQPITQRLSSPSDYRNRQNILPRSNDFTSAVWTKTFCSVAKDAVGPDEIASSAHTLTRTVVGAARMWQAVTTGYTAGQPLVFSVWAKAGTHNTMGLQVQATDISGKTQQLAPNSKPFKLSSRWERYFVVCPWVPSTTGIEVAVIHDIVGGGGSSTNLNSALIGTTILVTNAQLEPALQVGAYIDNPSSTIRAALPFQSQVIGRNVAVRTTAASKPSAGTGRWEAGDTWVDQAPALGGIASELCITSGAPGTWVVTSQAGVPHATTTQLQDSTHAINTANKFTDKRAWNDTTNRPVFAAGSTAGAVWYTTTGSATLTPV